MAKLSLIAAMSDNYVIGRGGTLPWDIKEDMRHFRDTTAGHAVIMGRRTFDSIGKPLPNRMNVVVSRQAKEFPDSQVQYADSLEKAIEIASVADPEEIFVIGGATLYQEALPRADRLYLTIIHQEYEGDTFFPRDPDYRKEFPSHFLPDRTITSESGIPISFLSLERA